MLVLQILQLLSIALMLIAIVIAVRLISKTKYSISWILFTLALILLCFMRIGEYAELIGGQEWRLPPHFLTWLGVIISLCLGIGIFYVRKIFKFISTLDYQRRLTERRILTTILRTEEKERVRLSKELHDGLGPLLSSAKMSLSELGKGMDSRENTKLIANTSLVIDEAIRCLREISNNLSPHTLEAFGLAKALNNFIKKTALANASKNVDIKFETNLKSERFDINVEVILYRVICELITNSLKHSGGSEIYVSLRRDGGIIIIHYSDNGKGFDPHAVLDTGMGLSNITSRIRSLHGTVDIWSERHKGMTADIMINLEQIDERNHKI